MDWLSNWPVKQTSFVERFATKYVHQQAHKGAGDSDTLNFDDIYLYPSVP